MKIRYPLAVAAAVAATELASGQAVQVQFAQPARAFPATPTVTPATPASTEFKPAANTDPDPKSLTVPADLQKKAKELVGKLGHPTFKEREKATRELATMGRMALPALLEAIGSSPEPEVALRAEGLMPKAEAEDMKARVSCFLADGEGKFEHTLPGWEKFKAVAGTDKPSRKLFAEMLKSRMTHQMLLAAEKTPDEANAVLNQYITRLWAQQNGMGGRLGGWNDVATTSGQTAKLPDLVACLFLESQFTDKEVIIQPSMPWGWGGQQYHSAVNYLYNVSDVSNAVYSNSGEFAAPIRKIMVQWMDSRETTQGAYQAYNFANSIYSNDRKKVFKYAVKVLEGDGGQNNSYTKINILSSFTNQTGVPLTDVVPAIAKCFDDGLMIWNWQNGNPGFDIQLRDYALAVALQLADQKPEDYGMSRTNATNKNKDWSQQAFYFKDDNPPKNNPNGVVVRPGRLRGGAVPVEEEKKDDKKEEKKDDKKDETKKLSQEDRRKIAFKKFDDFIKDGGLTAPKKDPKAEPAKDGGKTTEPAKDGPKPEPKPADPKKEEPKKDGAAAEDDAKKKEADAAKAKDAAIKKEAEQKAAEQKKKEESDKKK